MTNIGINNNLNVIDVMCEHQLIIDCYSIQIIP